jgi:hypothetical protein
MSKTLLYHPERYSVIRSVVHFEKLWDNYFNREPIDFTRVYDPSDYIIVVPQPEYKTDNWFKPYIEQGFKIVVEYLWDNDITVSSTATNQVLTLKSANWSRYNEALWYIDLGYNKIKINSTQDKFFLSTMRLTRPHRDDLLKKVEPYLADSLYSYTSKGIMLPNDKIVDGDVEQRFINPDWYTSTAFSLVSEASTRYPTFISEKTFKPIAFRHPFIVWGSPETLKYLHTSGFETFEHIFDETYDTIFNNTDRLNAIIEQVDRLYEMFQRGQLFTDMLTKEKLEHNRNHFYNKDLLIDMFNREVLEPLVKFANE